MKLLAIGCPATGLPLLSKPFFRAASWAAGVPGAAVEPPLVDAPGMKDEGENPAPGGAVEAVGAGDGATSPGGRSSGPFRPQAVSASAAAIATASAAAARGR